MTTAHRDIVVKLERAPDYCRCVCDCMIHRPTSRELTPQHTTVVNPKGETWSPTARPKGGMYDAQGFLTEEGLRRLRHSYGGLIDDKTGFSKEGPPPLTAMEARNLRDKIGRGDHNPIMQGKRLCFQTYPANGDGSGDYHIVSFSVPRMENPNDTVPHEQAVKQMQEHPLYSRSIAIMAVGVEAFPSIWPPFLQVLDWRWSNAVGRSVEQRPNEDEEGKEKEAVFRTRPLPPYVRCLVLRHCANLREPFLSGACLGLDNCLALEELDTAHSGLEQLPDTLPPCLRSLQVGFCHLMKLDLGSLPASLELADVSYNFVSFLHRELPGPAEGMAVAKTTVNMEGNRTQLELDMGIPQVETKLRMAKKEKELPDQFPTTSVSTLSFAEVIRRPRNSDVAMLRRFFSDDHKTVLDACFEATVLRAIVQIHINCAHVLDDVRSTFRAHRRKEDDIPAVDDVQAMADSLGIHRLVRKRGLSVRDPPTNIWGKFKKVFLSSVQACASCFRKQEEYEKRKADTRSDVACLLDDDETQRTIRSSFLYRDTTASLFCCVWALWQLGGMPSDAENHKKVRKRLVRFVVDDNGVRTRDARERYLDLLDLGIFLLTYASWEPVSTTIDALRVSPLQELSNRIGCARGDFRNLGANAACEQTFFPSSTYTSYRK